MILAYEPGFYRIDGRTGVIGWCARARGPKADLDCRKSAADSHSAAPGTAHPALHLLSDIFSYCCTTLIVSSEGAAVRRMSERTPLGRDWGGLGLTADTQILRCHFLVSGLCPVWGVRGACREADASRACQRLSMKVLCGRSVRGTFWCSIFLDGTAWRFPVSTSSASIGM